MYPDNLKYTHEHEWVRSSAGVIRVGITDHAQQALGDVVYVTLPGVGSNVEAGQPFGEVESTKSVSDLYTPVGGTVRAINELLDSQPDLVNSDPYGDGWMVEIEPADPGELDAALDELMSAEGYQAILEEEE